MATLPGGTPRGGIAGALWAEPDVQLSLALCERLGKAMYEMRPDLFPYGRLTGVEQNLWVRYFEYKKEVTGKTPGT